MILRIGKFSDTLMTVVDVVSGARDQRPTLDMAKDDPEGFQAAIATIDLKLKRLKVDLKKMGKKIIWEASMKRKLAEIERSCNSLNVMHIALNRIESRT